MSSIVERISEVKSDLENRYGKFTLFCMVELEDFKGRWDVVASASWFPSSEFQALSLLTDHIHDNLSKEELLQILGVVVLSPEEPFVNEVLALVGNCFNDCVITGLSIKTLHILSPQRTQLEILEEFYRLGLTDLDIDNLLEYLEEELFSPTDDFFLQEKRDKILEELYRLGFTDLDIDSLFESLKRDIISDKRDIISDSLKKALNEISKKSYRLEDKENVKSRKTG